MNIAEMRNRIPPDFSMSDLKGDLHGHSEGRGEKNGQRTGSHDATLKIEDLVEWGELYAPQAEYYVVSDHVERFSGSQYRFTEKDKDGNVDKHGIEYVYKSPRYLKPQLQRIAELNKNRRGFQVIPGLEVSIQGSGEINTIPEILKKVELVIASDHYDGNGGEPAEVTRRWIKALSNPYVDILGHPGRRYALWQQLDWESIVRAAVYYDRAIEINMQSVAHWTEGQQVAAFEPARHMALLELFAKTGVKVSLGSDAHRFSPLVEQTSWNLAQLLGIRRVVRDMNLAGIKKSQVLNTRSAAEVIEWAKNNNKEKLGNRLY